MYYLCTLKPPSSVNKRPILAQLTIVASLGLANILANAFFSDLEAFLP